LVDNQDNEECPLELIKGWDSNILMPGDIIIYTDANYNGIKHIGSDNEGHAMLYIGTGNISNTNIQVAAQKGANNQEQAIAHASGHGKNIIISKYEGDLAHEAKGRYNYTIRVKNDWAKELQTTTNYSLDVFNQNNSNFRLPSEINYQELKHVNYETNKKNVINYGEYAGKSKAGFIKIVESISDVIGEVLNFILSLPKVIILGWINITHSWLFENIANQIIGMPSSNSITIESIIFNKVPFLDINFFDFSHAGGEELRTDSFIYIIREVVANWYIILRTIGIVLMLVALIYIAIRMAMASIGEQKAKYKQMFKDWVLGFVILFFMHYIMIAAIEISQSILELFHSNTVSEASLYEQILLIAYDSRVLLGYIGTIVYVVLIVLTIVYFVIYLKRFFSVLILTLFAPIVAITYAIDKIKDNKSQVFDKWFKEYLFHILMQLMHGIIYMVFISTAFSVALQGFGEMGIAQDGLLDSILVPSVFSPIFRLGQNLVNIIKSVFNVSIATVFLWCSLRLEKLFRQMFFPDMVDNNKLPETFEAALAMSNDLKGDAYTIAKGIGKVVIVNPIKKRIAKNNKLNSVLNKKLQYNKNPSKKNVKKAIKTSAKKGARENSRIKEFEDVVKNLTALNMALDEAKGTLVNIATLRWGKARDDLRQIKNNINQNWKFQPRTKGEYNGYCDLKLTQKALFTVGYINGGFEFDGVDGTQEKLLGAIEELNEQKNISSMNQVDKRKEEAKNAFEVMKDEIKNSLCLNAEAIKIIQEAREEAQRQGKTVDDIKDDIIKTLLERNKKLLKDTTTKSKGLSDSQIDKLIDLYEKRYNDNWEVIKNAKM